MADVRCPMCGKPNPEDIAECLHCGSRLKPLRVGDLPEQAEGLVSPAAPKAPAEKPPPPSGADVTLLRQTLRDRGEPPAESEPETSEAGALESERDETPAWLRRLRAQSGLPSSPPQPRGETKKKPPQPEPPQVQPQQPPPPEIARRRTTSELLSSLRATVQQRRLEPEKPPAEAEAGDDIPDWLGALRRHSAVQPEPPPPESPPPPEPTGEMPEWLLSLREHAVPEEAAGETLAPPTSPPSALGQGARGGPWGRGEPGGGVTGPAEPGQTAEEGSLGEAPPPTGPTALWGRGAGLAPEATPEESLDWLTLAQPLEAEESPAWPPLPTEAGPANQAEAPSSPGWPGQPADDFPEWLKTLASSAEQAPLPVASASERPNVPRPEEAPAAEPAEPSGEIPDWLSTLGAPVAESPAAEELGETPEWLRTYGATEPGAPMEHPLEGTALPKEPPAGTPDWLQSLQDAGPVPEAPAEQASALPDWLDNLPPPRLGAPAEAAPPGELDEARLGTEALAEPVEPASMPDWLLSLAPEPSATPTQPSPFVQPEQQPEFSTGPEAPQEAQAEAPGIEASVEVPDWLAAMRSTERPQDVAAPSAPPSPASTSVPPFVVEAPASMGYLPPETGSPGDLERATLPAWLEAMRPLPVARPSPSTTSEYEETTGPLAGMKGIIAAEPAIALPTVRLSAAAQPAVSETHLAQARLIQALVKDEAAPHAAPRRPVARPIVVLLERWLIFAVLAIAVVAPFILEGSAPMFGHPSLFPVETVAARDVVANLPAGRPVLVAFEYEPGAAGEMDLLAGALLDHLADRGLYIVGVSTRPLGPALAQAALETSSLPLQAGETARDRYVNLGYLPGGVMALPVFAADPRSLVSGDFSAEMPDPEAPPPDVWQHSNLFNVHSLADFGLIAVLSNSPEAVRAWIEQAAIARGGIAGPAHPPMIALVSASAEPLVHPYFLAEGANSSLQGLVSGPFGATDYALLAGATGGAEVDGWPDVAAWRWDAQALGQLAAVVIIAVGALIFGSFSLLRRREERPS